MIKTLEERKVYIFWAVSIACIAIGVVTTNYLSIIALLLFGIAVLTFRSVDILSLLFGLIPFANLFKLSPSSMSLFTICELLAVISMMYRKKVRVLFLAVLLIMTTFLLSFSFNNFNMFTIVKVVCGFLLLYFAGCSYDGAGIKTTARLLSLSTVVMLLLSLNGSYFSFITPYFNDLDYLIDSSGHASNVFRLSGFLGDPNYCAVLIIMTLSFLCVLYYYKSIGNEFWIYVFFLVPIGFFTYSKSYFLCMVILIVMLIVFVLVPKHRGWAIVALIGMGFVSFLIMTGQIPVIDVIIQRFSQGKLTTGRTELNKAYLNYIFNDIKVLLVGEGISSDRFIGSRNSVHNIYIELLYKTGIFGSVLYISTLLCAFNIGKHKNYRIKKHFINYLPLFFFLVMFGFLGGVVNYALPFYIIIAYLGINYQRLASDDKRLGMGDD